MAAAHFLRRSSEDLPTHAETMRVVALLLVALLAAGCAATPGRTTGDDRWEGINRGVYKFNDASIAPRSSPSRRATRRSRRTGCASAIGNFFAQSRLPRDGLNQFLQGKGKLGPARHRALPAEHHTSASAGILDVATAVGLEANDEDFGQTLAVWGVGSGPFVTLPFFGPSSVRDAPARVVDFFLDPLDYMDVPWEAHVDKARPRCGAPRAELLTLDPTLHRTFDPYAFMRDAWIQRREFEIFDGNPPPEILDEEFIEPDERLRRMRMLRLKTEPQP